MGVLRRFWNDESGATAVEYGLIAASIAIAIINVLRNVGTRSSGRLAAVANNLT